MYFLEDVYFMLYGYNLSLKLSISQLNKNKMQKGTQDEQKLKVQEETEKVKSICKSISTLQGGRCMFYYMKCKRKVSQTSKYDVLLILKSAAQDKYLRVIDKPTKNAQINEKFLQTQYNKDLQTQKIQDIHQDGNRLIIYFRDTSDKQVQLKCYLQNKQTVRQWIRVLLFLFNDTMSKKAKAKQEESLSQMSEQPVINKMAQNRDKKESRNIKMNQTLEQNSQKTKDTYSVKVLSQPQVFQSTKTILYLERQIEDITNMLKIQKETNQNLRTQNSKMQQQVSQFENWKHQNLQNLSVINKLNRQKNILTADIRNLEQNLSKKDTLIRKLQDDLKTVKLNQTVNNERKQKQVQRFKAMLLKYQLQEQNHKQEKQTLQFHIKKMENEVQRLMQNEYTMKNKIESAQYLHIFEGDILQNSNCFKQYLKSEIQNVTCNEILKTKILYRYDPRNTSNFHNYIDGVQHIVLIVKTQSGSYLAAFTESSFRSGQVPKGRGLIFALNNMKSFKLYEDKKAISYDDFYIIFGNSQIRIRTQQNKIFSNFGINNSFYNSDGCKIDTLLNEGSSREVLIEGYEVHQIVYKNYF